MKLNFQERVTLLQILPEEEGYIGLREIRRAREGCAISADEATKYGKKMENGQFNIDFRETASIVKEIPFGEWMTGKIQDILREMDRKKKLRVEHMSLYDKFVNRYQQYAVQVEPKSK